MQQQKSRESDFLIVGSGIIGLFIARTLKKQHPDASILILDKETDGAFHASGRNSGVLHAGFYYTADSLKARFTKEGCLRLTDYCVENQIPLLNCGKLVVAQSEEDLPQIDELLKRAQKNQVELHEVSAKEAVELEPNVRFHKRVLWSPKTSVVDPKQVVRFVTAQNKELGIQFLYNTAYLKRLDADLVETTAGPVKFKYLINCAGLYADKIAKDFGFAKNLALIPFKGLYLKSTTPLPRFLKRHIYPVPNLNNPFLGVHFTVTVDGHVKIGPTAIPAFWREQYKGFERFSLAEFCEMSLQGVQLLNKSGFDFQKLALEEFKKYSKRYLRNKAKNLVQHMDAKDFDHWGPSGIRAQLIHTDSYKLEMDYAFDGDKNSFHVLNAVSPAFTSSIPFSEFIVEKISNLTKN